MSDFKTLQSARKQRMTSLVLKKDRGNDDARGIAQDLSKANLGGDPTDGLQGLYKAIPPTLQIRTSNETGRGLYSTANYKSGDILFSVKPHAAALSLSHLDGYCSSCFGAGDGADLKRCSVCKTVMYCSSDCQSKDWSFHKNECNALQQWTKAAAAESSSTSGQAQPPSDALRCLGRTLWTRCKLGSSHILTREFDNMQSHRSALSKDPGSFNSEIHTHLAHGAVGYLGLTDPTQLEPYGIYSAADLVDFVSRFTTNTFTVTTPTLSPLGACVAPSVALINHSCDPNAVVVFPRAGGQASKDQEPLLQVIALKHIHPGDEVLTSYIDTTLPRDLRQKALKETYHFTCKCPLCSPPADAPLDMREAMWCPKRCGALCCLPTEQDSVTRCSKCKAVVKDTDAILDALRIGQEALEKAEKLQDSDPKKALQLTENLSRILVSAGLVPGAHPLLALSRLHTSLLIRKLFPRHNPDTEEIFSPQLQQQPGGSDNKQKKGKKKKEEREREAQGAVLDEAIRSATRANTGLSQVLCFGHPVRGVSLAEMGKLLVVDEPAVPMNDGDGDNNNNNNGDVKTYPPSGFERLKLARDVLVRARAEVVVGFGGGRSEGGEVGREVRRQIVDVEKELGVWSSGVRNVLQGLAPDAAVQSLVK